MKRNLLRFGLALLVLCFTASLLTGCAKKVTLKEEAAVSQEQTQVAATPEKAAVAADAKAARDTAARDQALKDQAAKEAADKAKKADADRAAKEAADKAQKAAAAKAEAILKELQIMDIRFDFDRYTLRPEAKAILMVGAPAYLKYKDYRLVVEGHCDERGTAEYNLALGQKRADEAAKYLADLGIDKTRIKTISYGKEMPLDKGHDETAWAKNRRGHFQVVAPGK